MVNPEITTILLTMRDRLERAKMVRSIVGGETPEERLRRAIFIPPTTIARSESIVSPEQSALIMEKMLRVRRWVIEKGVLESSEASEDLAPYWIYRPQPKSGRVRISYISADKDTPENRAKAPVTNMLDVLGYDESGNQFVIDFGFENEFSLEIGFTVPRLKGLSPIYHSGPQPISDMTEEEAKITDYWLDYCLNVTQGS